MNIYTFYCFANLHAPHNLVVNEQAIKSKTFTNIPQTSRLATAVYINTK